MNNMSQNRVVTTETKELFTAAERGDNKTLDALIESSNVDLNWQKSEEVREIFRFLFLFFAVYACAQEFCNSSYNEAFHCCKC